MQQKEKGRRDLPGCFALSLLIALVRIEDVGTNKPRGKEETEQKVDGETGLWNKAASLMTEKQDQEEMQKVPAAFLTYGSGRSNMASKDVQPSKAPAASCQTPSALPVLGTCSATGKGSQDPAGSGGT